MSASIAASAFGLGAVVGEPEPVARGAMGQVWKVTTASGRWAVKELFWGADPDSAEGDVAFQTAALAVGVRLPRPVRAPATGAILVDVDGRSWRAYEWADLGPPLDSAGQRAMVAHVGSLLARLDRAGATWPGGEVDPWYTTVPAAGRWEALTTRAPAAALPWTERLDALRADLALLAEVVAAAAARPPSALVRRCHRDLGRDNVRPPAGGGPMVVLDWENAGPCDPAREMGALVVRWCRTGGVSRWWPPTGRPGVRRISCRVIWCRSRWSPLSGARRAWGCRTLTLRSETGRPVRKPFDGGGARR